MGETVNSKAVHEISRFGNVTPSHVYTYSTAVLTQLAPHGRSKQHQQCADSSTAHSARPHRRRELLNVSHAFLLTRFPIPICSASNLSNQTADTGCRAADSRLSRRSAVAVVHTVEAQHGNPVQDQQDPGFLTLSMSRRCPPPERLAVAKHSRCCCPGGRHRLARVRRRLDSAGPDACEWVGSREQQLTLSAVDASEVAARHRRSACRIAHAGQHVSPNVVSETVHGTR